jgi:hypothetical protein
VKGAAPDDLALMNLQARVLFRHDRSGRLRVINEAPYRPAPRLFVGLTRVGAVVRWREATDRALAEAAAAVLAVDESSLTDLLRLVGAQASDHVWLGPAYVFPEVGGAGAADVVRITRDNARALARHFPYTRSEWRRHEPCLARLQGGHAVAVCMSARHTRLAAEASLHTVEAFRQRGHGAAVARAWARTLQCEGRIALYSTSAQNLASQAVARTLGLRLYGIDVHVG